MLTKEQISRHLAQVKSLGYRGERITYYNVYKDKNLNLYRIYYHKDSKSGKRYPLYVHNHTRRKFAMKKKMYKYGHQFNEIIREKLEAGYKVHEIMDKYGISQNYIHRIRELYNLDWKKRPGRLGMITNPEGK